MFVIFSFLLVVSLHVPSSSVLADYQKENKATFVNMLTSLSKVADRQCLLKKPWLCNRKVMNHQESILLNSCHNADEVRVI